MGSDSNFPSPVAASRSYDTAGRMTASEIAGWTYDAAGRITGITQNLGQPANSDPQSTAVTFANVTFSVGYDAVGRITSFSDSTGGSTSFSYDANGNRLAASSVQGASTDARTYTVAGGSNRLLGFTRNVTTAGGSSTSSASYAYNANGDITADGLRAFVHDAEGRLSSAATGTSEDSPATRYAHNALGQRVFKTEPLYSQLAEEDPGFLEQLWSFFRQLWAPQTQSTEMVGWAYAYDEDGTLLSEVGQGGPQSSGASHYIWLPTANGPMPIAAIVNGNTYAVHADHLNTPRRLTDEQGRPAWQWKYSAFGDEAPTKGAKRFVDPEVMPGYGNGVVADVSFNLRYPGQYADVETGLFYNYFRSYDSRTGRYTQPDPIGLDGGWNRFAYVSGAPLRYADPRGLFFTPETLWDVGNLAYDLWNGNWEDAAWDAAAMCIPGVPAGMTKLKKLGPIKDAAGPHTVWKTDAAGNITRHETYVPNSRNPTGWDKVQSTDVTGKAHFDKTTGTYVPTPHTQGPAVPGGVRPATPSELPKRR